MKVAAVQFRPKFKDVQGNLQRMTPLIHEAAQNQAEIVVLPELCTTGYGFMSRGEAEPLCEQISDFSRAGGAESMNHMHALCKLLNVCIVWGVAEIDFGSRDLFNTQVLMTPSGNHISYRKVNLWGNDWLWSKGGQSNPPVTQIRGRDGKVKKVGLLICRDAIDQKDSNWTEFYEPGDADFVCFSANWGDGGFPSGTWMSFVDNNKCCLVVSNRYGYEIPNQFGEGGACIIHPDQSIHVEGLKWNEDCIVYGDV